MKRRSKLVSSSLALFLACTPLLAQKSDPKPDASVDLTAMNIEDLMNVKVISVSRTEEKLSRTASAVFVITPADIVRSGATNIPDVLRMVPGLDVAQIDANTWANCARGFEIAVDWKVTDRWTISPAYDFERFHMHLNPSSQDTGTLADTEGSDPHLHAGLRSHVDLSKFLAWDASASFVDRVAFQGVPSYTRVDTGLTWRCGEHLTFSLVGQNLAQNTHLEFVETSDDTTLVKGSGYAKVAWNFK